MPAVFVRELRRSFRSYGPWISALSLGFLIRLSCSSDPPGTHFSTPVVISTPLLMCLGGALIGAIYSAWRTVANEREEDTLTLLAATPIGAVSYFFQVAGSTAAVWLSFAVLALMVGSVERIEAWAQPGVAIAGVAVVFVGALHGSLGMFRFGQSWLGSISGFLEATLVLSTEFTIMTLLFTSRVSPGLVAFPVLAVGVFGWGWLYHLWLRRGGRWPESLLSDENAPRMQKRPGAISRFLLGAWRWPVPDGISPVLWRELQLGDKWTIAAIGAGIIFFVFSVLTLDGNVSHRGLAEAILTMGASFGVLIVTLVAASRTSSDLKSGVWNDIIATPLSPWSIVHGRVLGITATAVLVLIPWAASFVLETVRPARLFEWTTVFGFSVSVILIWMNGALAGFLGGTFASGWAGGFLGLFFLWLTWTLCHVGLLSACLMRAWMFIVPALPLVLLWFLATWRVRQMS